MEITVNVPFTLSELNSLIVDVESSLDLCKKLNMQYSAQENQSILNKLNDAKDRWFAALDEEE